MTDDPLMVDAVAAPPSTTLAEFMPLPEGERQYPLEYIDSNSVVKLREDEAEVLVGICDPVSGTIMRYLRRFHEKPVRFYRIQRSELAAYLGKRISVLESESPRGPSADDERILLDRLANDAPIVNLVNSLMIDAIRRGASDIHIESFSRETRVRYRIDGVLQVSGSIEKEKFPAVASRIKIMANLNIMERRLPQDGRISVNIGEETFDVRVSIVPIAAGESIVLRLYTANGAPLELEDLGIDEGNLALISRLVRVPHGMILSTGPTGSGKSTTLNSLLKRIASTRVKVVTIEDPVEYLIDGIDQIQVNDRIGLSFESLLRRVLRQDPDIVMVGEIRDAPTAELSVRAALTGHLVLSTLHTNDAVSALPRLKNMGVEPYLLAAVLRGILAQRLVRRVCTRCVQPVKPSRDQAELLRRHGLSADTLYKGAGCDECGGTGYKGRTSIVEAFCSDETIEEMILKSERASAITSYLETRGFVTLARRGLEKAVKGTTTVEEVEKVVMS